MNIRQFYECLISLTWKFFVFFIQTHRYANANLQDKTLGKCVQITDKSLWKRISTLSSFKFWNINYHRSQICHSIFVWGMTFSCGISAVQSRLIKINWIYFSPSNLFAFFNVFVFVETIVSIFVVQSEWNLIYVHFMESKNIILMENTNYAC